jgi:CRP-like cAMP-binding protein
MPVPDQTKIRNRVLSALSPEAFKSIAPYLEPVGLPLRTRMEQANRRVEFAYFLEDGMASVVVRGPKGHQLEAGLIGRDGLAGLGVLYGVEKPAHEMMMQLEGHGHRVPAKTFATALANSRDLDLVCRRYAYAFLIQVGFTAFANGRHNIEERLARWLLMSQDRSDSEKLGLTHDFLAMMLGVLRPGVTLALSLLSRKALIGSSRGKITILDREGLVELAEGSYGPAEAQMNKLFPN